MNKQEIRFLAEAIYKEDYKANWQDFILSPREFNVIAEIFLAQVENESGTLEFLVEGSIRIESENHEVWTVCDNGMTLEEMGIWIGIVNELHNEQKTGLQVDLKLVY